MDDLVNKRVRALAADHGLTAVSRPLEVVQIDHTEIDIIVVDELTRTPLPGRPWLTLAIDVFSRVVTGLHVDECAITRVGRPARNGIRKSSLTLTAHLRLGPASVSSQNAQRREKSRSLMPRCQATTTVALGMARHRFAWDVPPLNR